MSEPEHISSERRQVLSSPLSASSPSTRPPPAEPEPADDSFHIVIDQALSACDKCGRRGNAKAFKYFAYGPKDAVSEPETVLVGSVEEVGQFILLNTEARICSSCRKRCRASELTTALLLTPLIVIGGFLLGGVGSMLFGSLLALPEWGRKAVFAVPMLGGVSYGGSLIKSAFQELGRHHQCHLPERRMIAAG